jgi:hypothetical protein
MEHRVKSPQPPFTKGGRGGIIIVASVVRPTLLYISSEAVIPAPHQVRDKLQRESSSKILDSPVSSTGQAQSSPE